MASRKVETIGVVKIRWNAATREYLCTIPGVPAATYYTSDIEDARASARDMDRRCKVAIGTLENQEG